MQTQTTLSCKSLHWSFSLDVYGMPSVQESCLALQDDIGLDVNVLLLSLLAGKLQGRALAADEISGADALICAWRTEVVAVLRAVRRRMKAGPLPAPSEATDSLREDIKRAELKSERIQQVELAAYLDCLQTSADQREPHAHAGQSDILDLTAQRVLDFYAQSGQGLRSLSNQNLVDHVMLVAAAAHRAQLRS